MMQRLLRVWRIVRWRCILCGNRRNHKSILDRIPNPRCCRWCNKRFRFGTIYGIDRRHMP